MQSVQGDRAVQSEGKGKISTTSTSSSVGDASMPSGSVSSRKETLLPVDSVKETQAGPAKRETLLPADDGLDEKHDPASVIVISSDSDNDKYVELRKMTTRDEQTLGDLERDLKPREYESNPRWISSMQTAEEGRITTFRLEGTGEVFVRDWDGRWLPQNEYRAREYLRQKVARARDKLSSVSSSQSNDDIPHKVAAPPFSTSVDRQSRSSLPAPTNKRVRLSSILEPEKRRQGTTRPDESGWQQVHGSGRSSDSSMIVERSEGRAPAGSPSRPI
eukprot:g15541.t1